jgi:formate dehydrogenase major subunit
VGGLAAVGSIQLGSVRKASRRAGAQPGVLIQIKKNICTHCSVGCTVTAEVRTGVWVGQEPSWDSPINRGTHCAKGAAIREIVLGDRRLKYPMKLTGGQWQRISWDQAINEIGDKMLQIRSNRAPIRLLARLRQVHQRGRLPRPQVGRLLGHELGRPPGPHLPLDHVAGVANTWGYGRRPTSYIDILNAKSHGVHRLQRGRGAPGRDAASPRRQEDQPANLIVHGPRLHPHGRARTEVRPLPSGHRHRRLSVGQCSGTSSRTAGRTRNSSAKRVYGMDDVRKEWRSGRRTRSSASRACRASS